jgi:signal transduction histidine kinase/ligand-binding sensor domain-containing protein
VFLKHILIHNILLSLAALLCGLQVLYAQPEEQRFRSITIDDGLSQSTVVAICQDSLGFLWFGTKNGLNLYDGYNFKVFHHDREDTNSIGGNNILSLVVDGIGNIWAGAGNGTLSRYCHTSQKFRHYSFVPIKGQHTQLSAIQELAIDGEGYVWVGTREDGLYKLDPNTGSYKHYYHKQGETNGPTSNTIYSLCYTPERELWIGTYSTGLSRYFIDRDSFEHFNFEQNNFTDFHIYTIFRDSNARIWVGSENNGWLYDKETNRFNPFSINPLNFPTASVTAFAQTDTNNIWLAVYPQGIMKLNIETRKWQHYQHDAYSGTSLNYNDVRRFFVDRTQNLWIGTNGGGVNMLAPNQNFKLYRHIPSNSASLPHNSVRAILEDSKHNLYVGLYGGLMVYNQTEGTYQLYESNLNTEYNLSSSAVYCLMEEKDGKIWLGLEGGGLQLFNPETGTFKVFQTDERDSSSLSNGHVLSLLLDSEQRLWVGTHRGLDLFNRETQTFIHFPSVNETNPVPFVRSILEDKPGYLWLGTDMGIMYFEIETGKTIKFPDLQYPASNAAVPVGIYYIYKDAPNNIWIGTQGNGLYQLNYKCHGLEFDFVEFTCTDSEGSYSKLTVYGILEDKDRNLWLSSDNGLYSYSKRNGTWHSFNKTDGLQSNEFNAGAFYKANNGKMYFGGINGLNSFFPEQLKYNTTPPPVVLTDFKVFNKSYPLKSAIATTKKILLNYNENHITFEFAALDFTAPENNEYAYKLVGFDADWIYPGAMRQANYSNLPPGSYTFKVKASNEDGYWNEDGISVDIRIVPALWSTVWFKAILVVIGIIVLYFFFRLQLAGYKERQKLLEEQLKTQSQKLQLEKLKNEYAVSQALIEGQNQEQKRISEDLHDGLGQTLTAASLNLMALDTSLTNSKEGKTYEYLSNLQLLMGNAIQEVRNISHNLMPYLLAEEGLQAALEEMCHRAMKSGTLNINLQITGLDERIGESNEINLYRIAQEIISNAQKHSGAQNLVIKYHVGAEEIEWVSEDDGIGFDPAYLKGGRNTGLGLKNIQVRVELMKGTINIITKPGKGVIVQIKVPKL